MCRDPEYEMNFMQKTENIRQLYAYSTKHGSVEKPSVVREISFISIDASSEIITGGVDGGGGASSDTQAKSVVTLRVEPMTDEISTVVEEEDDSRQVQSLRGSRSRKLLEQRRKTTCAMPLARIGSAPCPKSNSNNSNMLMANSNFKTISFNVPKLKLNSEEMPKRSKKYTK